MRVLAALHLVPQKLPMTILGNEQVNTSKGPKLELHVATTAVGDAVAARRMAFMLPPAEGAAASHRGKHLGLGLAGPENVL